MARREERDAILFLPYGSYAEGMQERAVWWEHGMDSSGDMPVLE